MTGLENIIFVNHLNKQEQKVLRELKEKADKWDKLEKEVSKMYEEDSGDFCNLGEMAAIHFGYYD